MSFVEKAVEYNPTGLNCAESIIRAANEEYNLGIAESDYTMLSGFGSGVMTGNLCGAAAAGAAVLGKMYVNGRMADSPDARKKVQAFMRDFNETLGGTMCKDIRAKHQNVNKGKGCTEVVQMAAECVVRQIEAE